jgi:hypothetical protein
MRNISGYLHLQEGIFCFAFSYKKNYINNDYTLLTIALGAYNFWCISFHAVKSPSVA